MTKLKRSYRPGADPVDLNAGVEASVDPSGPYSTSGELELLRHRVDRLANMMGVLADVLDRANLLSREDIKRLTDWDYELTDEA